jgi:hypothetical protein
MLLQVLAFVLRFKRDEFARSWQSSKDDAWEEE